MTQVGEERIDCAVVGAGVVGLACARALARSGREVLVLEAGDAVGAGISSRSSEVIHAGLYYPPGSLKAWACRRGNRLLRAYAAERGVAFEMCGKLIVATDQAEEGQLAALLENGRANGVSGLAPLSAAAARAMEPALRCTAALLSADTGIIDSHGLLQSLHADLEEHGGTIALRTPVLGGRAEADGVRLSVGGAEPVRLLARTVVIAAGLGACAVGRAMGLARVPADHLCKGNYFTLAGRMPFSRLVYPVPAAAGLGVHYTLDLAGHGRFGPDVEWIMAEDYRVDPARAERFYGAIRRYWPDLADGALGPAYAGIRPKISAAGEPVADFALRGPADHGAAGVIALYGIESPGLTAALALAERVEEMAR